RGVTLAPDEVIADLDRVRDRERPAVESGGTVAPGRPGKNSSREMDRGNRGTDRGYFLDVPAEPRLGVNGREVMHQDRNLVGLGVSEYSSGNFRAQFPCRVLHHAHEGIVKGLVGIPQQRVEGTPVYPDDRVGTSGQPEPRRGLVAFHAVAEARAVSQGRHPRRTCASSPAGGTAGAGHTRSSGGAERTSDGAASRGG